MSYILTCNAGSTNTKLALFSTGNLLRISHVTANTDAEIDAWLDSLKESIYGVAHRVVHGGREFSKATILDDSNILKLAKLVPLAPLHQPAALQMIEAMRRRYPHIKQVACFDTAFHQSLPDIERRLPLPQRFQDQGLQRYGFHGLSYQHIADTIAEITGGVVPKRLIAVHLGGGASACAMENLKSIATTMGFSTLDGLMMSTRCGAIDPGALFYLLQEMKMPLDDLEQLLYKESGLLGVSGISADMRELLLSDKPQAKLAIELYCLHAARQIAGLIPSLSGLDALVFTGGIGENSVEIRGRIMGLLEWIGKFQVYVIPTNEELVLATSCSAKL